MTKLDLLVCVGLPFVLTWAGPGLAQSATNIPPPSASGQAADLKVLPRLGTGFTTTGAGYTTFSRFEGFLPLWQTPGSSLTFLEGRLTIDTEADLGGNILLGQRFYSANDNRIYGGYIAYDSRNTGSSVFNQLGAGFESLGDNWDFRANAYIPLGETRQMVEQKVVDRGFQSIGNPFFQDHFLVVQGQRQFQQTRRFEAAMAGFDVEAGTKLFKLGSQGDLRGYGGLYYYNTPGGNDALGWRLRLEARPTSSLSLGLSLQNDSIFGTNLILNVGATFPGTRQRSVNQETIARIGESVVRNSSIAVNSQTESKFFNQQEIIKASNPETNLPYFFQQVKLGANQGNGTFENSFGTVQSALNATRSDGNDIVYVQDGTNPGIPAFTIGSRVQVLSTAPKQLLNTVEFGQIQLPLSGAGVLPIVTDTVSMGNDSVLSGFAITGVTGAGVAARNINNAVIRDNTISSTNVAGVLLENTTGTLTLANNTITGTGVSSLVGTNINNLAISNSPLTSINSETDGIYLNGVTGNVAITDSPIIVTSPQGNGIFAENVTGNLNLTASNSSNISNTGNYGVKLSNSTGTIILSGFDITDTN
ncbi:MAG: inverse autotransporter beta domain-containing protein, partial [Coleofasciculaceae cyanobacterium]